jgi:hypothetical protein
LTTPRMLRRGSSVNLLKTSLTFNSVLTHLKGSKWHKKCRKRHRASVSFTGFYRVDAFFFLLKLPLSRSLSHQFKMEPRVGVQAFLPKCVRYFLCTAVGLPQAPYHTTHQVICSGVKSIAADAKVPDSATDLNYQKNYPKNRSFYADIIFKCY